MATSRKKTDDYDYQVIFNFNENEFDQWGGQARLLKIKWDKNQNHPQNTCKIILYDELIKKVPKLDITNKKVRIYLTGHCKPGANFLYSSNSKIHQKIHFTELAKQLASYLKDGGNNIVSINVISCCAAKGGTDEDKAGVTSFAAKLHYVLTSLLARNIVVVARVHVVFINPIREPRQYFLGRKETLSLKISLEEFLGYHHLTYENALKIRESKQLGSKVFFTIDDQGNQIKVDAYNQTIINSPQTFTEPVKTGLKFKRESNLLESSEVRDKLELYIDDIHDAFASNLNQSIKAEIDENKPNPKLHHLRELRLKVFLQKRKTNSYDDAILDLQNWADIDPDAMQPKIELALLYKGMKHPKYQELCNQYLIDLRFLELRMPNDLNYLDIAKIATVLLLIAKEIKTETEIFIRNHEKLRAFKLEMLAKAIYGFYKAASDGPEQADSLKEFTALLRAHSKEEIFEGIKMLPIAKRKVLLEQVTHESTLIGQKFHEQRGLFSVGFPKKIANYLATLEEANKNLSFRQLLPCWRSDS